MPDLTSFDNVYLFPGFLVPGLIILFVRSQFVTGRSTPSSPGLLPYLTVSIIYYALVLPFLNVDSLVRIHEPGNGNLLVWFTLIVFGPALLGVLLGVNVQKDLFRGLLQKCGLNPVHSIPTAWDWKFGGFNDEQWVLVTLKDGTRFAGFFGGDSFISSDPAERDIYIQSIWDIDDKGRWISPGEKGVLIATGEVQTVEFWPYNPQENSNEQK